MRILNYQQRNYIHGILTESGEEHRLEIMIDNFNITFEADFLRVVYTGEAEAIPVQTLLTQVPNLARNADVKKILCDVRSVTAGLSMLERFDYACKVAEQFKGLKVAFVVNEPLRDPNLFGETVAVNRGGNIRVLATLEDADKWLKVM